MIVVSNTSPIVSLASIGHLKILQQLYGKIMIPQAVHHEIVVKGAGKPGSEEVQNLEWIETRRVTNTLLLHALEVQLHTGEAEAIVQASEIQADLLLLDERNARKIASHMGLTFIGVLGVLIKAKQEGIIDLVQPLLNDLRIKAGFWISDNLYSEVLNSINE